MPRTPGAQPSAPWTRHRYDEPATGLPARCETVVIGAGYAGLFTAYRLAEAGVSVVVLDQGRLEDAASARNAGFCTISPPVPVAALAAEGAQTARAWLSWFERAVDHCEGVADRVAGFGPEPIGFRRVGNVRLAQTARQARALASQHAMLAELGFSRRLLAPCELDMPNDRAFSAGLADERSARLNPGALHLAIAHAARDAGAAIHQDHRAEDIRPAGDEAVVSVRGQEVRARHVVVATNGFTHTTVAPFHDYLLPVGSFAILTGPLDERIRLGALGRGRCHATSYRFPHYFRVTEGRRLLFGGRASLTTQADIEACGRWLLGRAQRIFPDLGLTRAEACWGGRLGFTPDKRPLLGQLSGQVLYAMGCAGHGVPTSLAMARDIADTILRRPLGDRAPFWRSPGEPPQRVSGLLRRGLPVAQIGLRCLDTGDRLRDALPGRVGPPHDGAAA